MFRRIGASLRRLRPSILASAARGFQFPLCGAYALLIHTRTES